jgi:hypothetical protein
MRAGTVFYIGTLSRITIHSPSPKEIGFCQSNLKDKVTGTAEELVGEVVGLK